MTESMSSTWEQPPFDDGLLGVAVRLITEVVQDVFRGLDPLALVQSAGGNLTPAEERIVAELINQAVVELDIDFSGCELAELPSQSGAVRATGRRDQLRRER